MQQWRASTAKNEYINKSIKKNIDAYLDMKKTELHWREFQGLYFSDINLRKIKIINIQIIY